MRRHGWWVAIAAFAPHVLGLRGRLLEDAVTLDRGGLRTLRGLTEVVAHAQRAAGGDRDPTFAFRPVAAVVDWLSWQWLRASLPLQHVLDVALHAAVSVLVYRVLAQRIARRAAFVLGVVVACHPIASEVVNHVRGRDATLAVLAVLAALYAIDAVAARPGSVAARGLGGGLAVASVLAALAHPCAVLAGPALAFAYAYVHAAAGAREARARRGVAVLVLVASTAAVLALARAFPLLAIEDATPAERAKAAIGVGARVVHDLLLPGDLAVHLTVPAPGAATWAAAVVIALGACAYAVRLRTHDAAAFRRAAGLVAVGAALFTGAVATRALASARSAYMTDADAYPALVGGVLLVAIAVDRAATRCASLVSARFGRGLAVALAPAVAAATIPTTAARDVPWRSDELLELALVTARPRDAEASLASASLAFQRGDLASAYVSCSRFHRARPFSHRADLCLATTLVARGALADAVPYLDALTGTAVRPDTALATLLGVLFDARALPALSALLDPWWRDAAHAPPPVHDALRRLAILRREIRRDGR